MSPPAQINLQTVKWEAGDFAAAGDDKLPMGKPAESGATATSTPVSSDASW